MDVAAIPSELRELTQWVVWRWEPPKNPGGKPTKPPYPAASPRRSAHASNQNPADWATLEDAVAVVEAGKADGIGLALTADLGIVGVDLDAELSEADQAAIVLALHSYTERSPSGTGQHVLVR